MIILTLWHTCCMTPKQFQKFLDRDKYCLHCGRTDSLVPQHRANRGHGGSKSADVPSNIIVLCSLFNGLIESDAKAARLARQYGWKISRYEKSCETPVFDVVSGVWWLLLDDFSKGKLNENWKSF